ncbi:DUF6879 family protein [Carbonactinospora thermoautotrophica]|uniref:DUF6879 family protein n=1 Tax=Carbonactinospora thermoautotrophica TaxID=1469144 RepID=UPI001FD0CC44|nr:DUF6879 family protein [Carbonactinospora thermoautotrophica]
MSLVLSPGELDALFQGFESSAFRLETLDRYTVPGEAEAFRRFLSGEEPPEEWKNAPWPRIVRANVAAGKVMQRVHVVRSPLSEYLRFEIGWGYHRNTAAGEDIRILDLSESNVSGLPDHDFWLFDGRVVVRMHYGPEGEFIGAERLPDDWAEDYVRYRDLALKNAVPCLEYWQRVSE